MIRPECGTLRGVLAHQAAGEDWCGWCKHAERVAALSAEGLPSPLPRLAPQVPRPAPGYAPVSAEQATRNAAALARETASLDLDWVDEPGGGRHLRALPPVAEDGAA